MRTLVIAMAATVSFAAAAGDKNMPLNLEAVKPGELPKGWTAAKTGEGEGSVWKVVEDKDAPGGKALAQTAKGDRTLYNLCIFEDRQMADVGQLEVSFKAVAGEVDQGGGLVWRYQDANNYYVARHNPLEKNFRLYKVVAGKRTQLATADVDAPAQKWHTIVIEHKGDRIRCGLNKELVLEAKDDAIKTAGKIGLWTKADAQTYFAKLKVESK